MKLFINIFEGYFILVQKVEFRKGREIYCQNQTFKFSPPTMNNKSQNKNRAGFILLAIF